MITMRCKKCNGDMIGDGYTTVVRCEYVEYPLDVEPDGNPIYCDYKDEEDEGDA